MSSSNTCLPKRSASIFDDLRPVGIKGHITDISFGNIELHAEHKDEKIGFLDIKVTTDMSEIID